MEKSELQKLSSNKSQATPSMSPVITPVCLGATLLFQSHTHFSTTNMNVGHNDKSEMFHKVKHEPCLSHNLPYVVCYDVDICATMNHFATS